MNKLAQLLKQTELFYQKSLYSLGQVQNASTYVMPDDPEEESEGTEEYNGEVPTDTGGILQAAEDLSYDIAGDEVLANQFDQFLQVYKDYLDGLKFDPQDVFKDPEQIEADAAKAGEDMAESIEAINNIYHRINKNPYLKLAPNDPKWKETFPPSKVINIIQAIFDDVNNKFKEATADESADISEATANRIAQELNQVQFDKGAVGARATGDKVAQVRDAIKRYRKKAQAAEKLGPAHPDYAAFLVLRRNQRQVYQNIKNDPERNANYKKENIKRQGDQRKVDTARFALIKKLQAASSPAEQMLIAKQLVKMEETALERAGYNLDKGEVRYDPAVQKLLNPEEIVKRHLSRLAKKEKRVSEESAKIKTHRDMADKVSPDTAGGVDPGLMYKVYEGLVTTFQRNIANVKMGIKKNITKKISGAEDTAFKPFKNEMDAAKSSGNAAAFEEAKKKLNAAMNRVAEADPALVEYVKYSVPYLAYRDKLNQLKNETIMDPNNPLGEDYRALIMVLVEEGESFINNPATKKLFNSPNQTLQSIVGVLKKRANMAMNKESRRFFLSAILKYAQGDTNELAPSPGFETPVIDIGEDSHQVFQDMLANLQIKGLDY